MITGLLSSLLEGCARAWSVCMLGCGVAAGLLGMSGTPLGHGLALFLAAALLLGARLLRTSSSPQTAQRWHRAGLTVVILATLVSLCWAWRFDSVQASDFGVYFRCGSAPRGNLSQWIHACQSDYLQPNLIYWTRSLLYSVPFGIVAGANYPAFKLYNALLHGATLLVWYFGLRHYGGPRAATVATVLLVLYPEWWFTLTLATTDNMALFCVAIFLTCLPHLLRSSGGMLVIPSLAVTLFALQQLRTIGVILALALIAWMSWWQWQRWSPWLLGRIVAVLALYTLGNTLFDRLLPAALADPLELLKVFSALDLGSDQSFMINYTWFEHFWPAIPPSWRLDVGLDILFVELTQHFSRYPQYLFHKAAVFFSGLGYYFFATADMGMNPDTVYTVHANTVPASPTLAQWLPAGVTLHLGLAGWTLLRARLDTLSSAALMVLVSFLGVVLGLAEAQPRYSVLIAPVLAWLAAAPLISSEQHFAVSQSNDERRIRYPVWTTVVGLGLLLCLYGVGSGLAYILRPPHTPLLVRTAAGPLPMEDVLPCNLPPLRLEASYKRLRLTPAPGATCMSVRIPVPPDTQALSFFVAGSRFPFPFEPQMTSPYRYRLLSADRLLLDDRLGVLSVRWHRVTFGPDDRLEVPLVLIFFATRDDLAASPEPLDIWWIRATTTDSG